MTKKNSKISDIVQKGGEVSEKSQILNVKIKVTLGGGAKQMTFFQDVFQVIICQFFSSSYDILRPFFKIFICFFLNI